VNKGDLVNYYDNIKNIYVVIKTKKYYYKFKDRIEVICPSSGNKIWFLKEDLEVLSAKI